MKLFLFPDQTKILIKVFLQKNLKHPAEKLDAPRQDPLIYYLFHYIREYFRLTVADYISQNGVA